MEYLDPVVVRTLLDARARPLADRIGRPAQARTRSRRAGRLARSNRQMLARLGRRLVILGRRLERYGPAQQRPDLSIR
jgi:hypothetical protein